MKRILSTVAAATLATGVYADTSTKYDDIRLDTRNSADVVYSVGKTIRDADLSDREADLRLDTSKYGQTGEPTFSSRNGEHTVNYTPVYGGYGPGNDSR
ncbi:hypothetical protein HTT03_01070 [Sulfitobacter sp. S0837]|uniref:hypothetical protein n=1 Tax=Sulfitobacter maritimus TaxID=2741719 RepID=UPI0015825A22|nr:hypothetical protein [Sulfitobacter maritimus]NUH63896.1 hypothetical protein [Sulfitobacter maritimus]